MSNEIQLFKFQEHEVRTVKEEDGQVWFVAKDVCDILELMDVTSALRTLDDDEKLIRKISGEPRKISGEPSTGGNPNMMTISESGLYTLIMRSNKPEAKQFRKWVTSEVLPTLRKTGSYSTVPVVEAQEEPKRGLPPIEWINAIKNAKDDKEAEQLDKIYIERMGESILEMLKPGYYQKKFDEEQEKWIQEDLRHYLETVEDDGIYKPEALYDFENKLGIDPHEKYIWARMAAEAYPEDAEEFKKIAQIYKKEDEEREAQEEQEES